MEEVDTKPWKKQRPFKKDASVIHSPEDICLLAESLPLNIGALVGMIYLGGFRISELVRYEKLAFDTKVEMVEGKKRTRYLWSSKRVIDSQPSLKKRQVEFVEESGIPVMLISARNLKNRKVHIKRIPINLNKDMNSRIAEVIKRYLEPLTPDSELFPYNRAHAEYKLKKLLPFNIHFLRDLRATHLSVINDMKEGELARYMGWTDSRPSDRYVQLKWRDLVSKT